MSLQNKFNVGIYCRLSRDDKDYNNESSSISNQKQFLTDYVKERGWQLREIYVDDGWTGTNFQRPDFTRMKEDMERGLINCCVTKDLSRFGRNYVKVGEYLEEYFPERNIRYIAVSDNIDTYDEYNDLAPFQNLFNEFYPKDVSKKVRAIKYSGMKKGDFMNSKPAYGYVKSPLDRHKLIIDEETAEIVRRIFQMYAAGCTGRYIAEKLTQEGIPNPRTYYYAQIGQRNPYSNATGSWNSASITTMLRNQAYIGNMVQGKRKTISFKSKKVRKTDPEQWIIVPGTHEPVIDADTWENVQTRLKNGYKAKTHSVMINGLFSGIIRCADCGSSLALNVKPRANGVRRVYKCSRYSNHGKAACSVHYVDESRIEQAILCDIKHYALLTADKDNLIDRLAANAGASQNKELQKQRTKLIDAEKRLKQIDDKIRVLFEEKVSGGISGTTFTNLMSGYERDREGAEKLAIGLQKEMTVQETKSQDVSKWVALIQKYIDIDSLDRETVFELVDSIIVSEAKKINGNTQQEIKIKYKFVGCLNPDKEEKSIANVI